jgi:hypothetical protein
MSAFPAGRELWNAAHREQSGFIGDSTDRCLSLAGNDHWMLHAIGGGHPVTLFGEWDGCTLTPLSVWANDRFYHTFPSK